ncbi:hypothetical protein DAEQUDRAFT_727523 [Daedalea quercina L-15889]|uniref:Uncharacterized protein n=1 Tax=Daedalea quercina L-15889 TaxID=1314783 RepID=A0A165PUY1_9APHY|nr:hypothetical protein DAEQUDRAFT_727523 [Daedalea quercina L-15889]
MARRAIGRLGTSTQQPLKRQASLLDTPLAAVALPAMLACMPPTSPMSPLLAPPHPTTFAPSHKRPRGLWKRRRDSPDIAATSHAPLSVQSSPRPSSSSTTLADDDDTSYDDDDRHSSSSASSKRRRCSGAFDSAADSRPPSPRQRPASVAPLLSDLPYHATHPPRLPLSRLALPHQHLMRESSTARHKGKLSSTADYEDWENLKLLFRRAVDRYDADDIRQALPLLRAVIRECHRFLTVHPDPSVVYTEPPPPSRSSPTALTPTDAWAQDVSIALNPEGTPSRPTERPAAFHALFGSTLFYLGTLIAQDPSIPLPDEPKAPSDYWLAALDVFQTGENLPALIGGGSVPTSGFADLTEDWRMAVIWGRALVCLADEKLTHSLRLAKERATGDFCALPSASPFDLVEPRWLKNSTFAAIAASRPPVSRRTTLYSATAHDVMVLAMDQFSRGIFHMPHVTYPASHNPASHVALPASPILTRGPSPPQPAAAAALEFSRSRELFTIASEVLGVAERLPDASQRAYWAGWAESVFTQMRMEAAHGHEAWRVPLTAARGRCWLVLGSAHAEELEAALEAGQDVLESPEAQEAREGLAKAVSFFERAKGVQGEGSEEDKEDVKPLLAEALFSLANLTQDENKREELYSRAQAEAGEDFMLDDGDLDADPDAMDVS